LAVQLRVRKALLAGCASAEAGAEWILEHDDDVGIDEPIPLVRREVAVTVAAAETMAAAADAPPAQVPAEAAGIAATSPPAADDPYPAPVPAPPAAPGTAAAVATAVAAIATSSGSAAKDEDEEEEALPLVNEALLAEILTLGFPEVIWEEMGARGLKSVKGLGLGCKVHSDTLRCPGSSLRRRLRVFPCLRSVCVCVL
jgi:hypothetical protein